MDQAAFAVEAAVEEEHWWFRGRRMLFASEIRLLGIAPSARVLDVGTGTGANLRMLRDNGFRNVTGTDASPEAVKYCAAKGLGEVQLGDIVSLPFAGGHFDLVLATDVIEHVDDDRGALAELYRVLAPGGHLLLTVPAFPSLWGLQDEVAHHKRRYRMQGLRELVHSNGFAILKSFHFNYLLFGPIWIARQVLRVLKPRLASENDVNSPGINKVLTALFQFDVKWAPRLQMPFGVSILILARKPA
ncbi:MAG TPA: class I SAM-dependent methyltransferase [Xanthobacteraceae bacterium]|nr:class I SAM-dependent methyltransferase [Xanthobacteraceae bacterium]